MRYVAEWLKAGSLITSPEETLASSNLVVAYCCRFKARMVELADTRDLKSRDFGRVGSTPTSGTKSECSGNAKWI